MFVLTLVYGWSGCVTSGECSMHRQLSQDSHNISDNIVFVLLSVVCFVISCLFCYQLFVLFCTKTCHSEMCLFGVQEREVFESLCCVSSRTCIDDC